MAVLNEMVVKCWFFESRGEDDIGIYGGDGGSLKGLRKSVFVI